jgi:hypothetical protein
VSKRNVVRDASTKLARPLIIATLPTTYNPRSVNILYNRCGEMGKYGCGGESPLEFVKGLLDSIRAAKFRILPKKVRKWGSTPE